MCSRRRTRAVFIVFIVLEEASGAYRQIALGGSKVLVGFFIFWVRVDCTIHCVQFRIEMRKKGVSVSSPLIFSVGWENGSFTTWDT